MCKLLPSLLWPLSSASSCRTLPSTQQIKQYLQEGTIKLPEEIEEEAAAAEAATLAAAAGNWALVAAQQNRDFFII